MLGVDACSGNVLLTSDDMGSWNEGQLTQYHNMLDVFLR